MMIGAMTKMEKIGDLQKIYDKQKAYQEMILADKGQQLPIPCDSVDWFKYHMLAIQEELGEVLKADKRWKTHRNERFVKEEKAEEIADVFITLLNVCMFSGMSCEEIAKSVSRKIDVNVANFVESKKNKGNE